MRKLASIQTITNIYPIKDKDNIVLAQILGWNVIVRKDQFQIGDKCVYVEIDSILPESNVNFEFLKKYKYRIKTIKMAGTISQGICFNLFILPNGINYKDGDDVTEILGIEKYEPDKYNIEEKSVEVKKNLIIKLLNRYSLFRYLFPTKKEKNCFPKHVTKTDQNRIQLFPHLLLDKTKLYVITEKLEGSSATYSVRKTKSFFGLGKDKFDYAICSRNIRFPNKKNNSERNSFDIVSDTYNIENTIKKIMNYFPDSYSITMQGELLSPKIQGNIYKLNKEDIYIFNIIIHYKNKKDIYLDYNDQKYYLNKVNSSVKLVPLIAEDYILPDTVEELLDFANGESKLYSTLREGLVLLCGNISFKAVSNEYLIKRGY